MTSSNKHIIHCIAQCQDCGKKWQDYRTARRLAREHAQLTYQAIANILGVDHTTVVYHHHHLRDAIDPNVVEERDNAEEFYRMLVKIEYDQEIPF